MSSGTDVQAWREGLEPMKALVRSGIEKRQPEGLGSDISTALVDVNVYLKTLSGEEYKLARDEWWRFLYSVSDDALEDEEGD
jgi:hypothetical protein